jgi:hypothetical protein
LILPFDDHHASKDIAYAKVQVVRQESPVFDEVTGAYPSALDPKHKEYVAPSLVPAEQRQILASMSIRPVQQMTDEHRRLLHLPGDDKAALDGGTDNGKVKVVNTDSLYPSALDPKRKEYVAPSLVPAEQREILASMSIRPVQQMTDEHRRLFLHFLGDEWRSAAQVVFPSTS